MAEAFPAATAYVTPAATERDVPPRDWRAGAPHAASALRSALDPDRLSIVRTLRVVRRQVIAQTAFPPDQVAAAIRAAVDELLGWPLGAQVRRTLGVRLSALSSKKTRQTSHVVWLSNRGGIRVPVLRPSGCLVVAGVGLQTAVEDADQAVGERSAA